MVAVDADTASALIYHEGAEARSEERRERGGVGEREREDANVKKRDKA